MIPIILGVLAGASIVLSRTVNAGLGQRIGVFHSTRMNYVTGLAISLLALRMVWEPMPEPVSFTARPDIYLGGLLGVAVVVISNLVAPRLSAFVMTLLVFISQFFTGMALDLLRYGTFSAGRAIGALLLLAGLLLYQSSGKAEASPEQENEAEL